MQRSLAHPGDSTSVVARLRAQAAAVVAHHQPLRRGEVRVCAGDLLVLAQRLRDRKPIEVRGAAMASRLLMNANSPLYRDVPGFWELKHEVRSARLALDPAGAGNAVTVAAA